MFLVIHKRRVGLCPGRWYSTEDVVRRARAASCWPRKKIYLDWGFGHEPIHTPEELHFAARLVQSYHCQDMEYDFMDQTATLEETRELEAEAERRAQEDDTTTDEEADP